MPYKPNKPLKRMKTNLKNLKALFISMVVNVRLDINVIAITIIVIGGIYYYIKNKRIIRRLRLK